jgi:hypothetical protein
MNTATETDHLTTTMFSHSSIFDYTLIGIIGLCMIIIVGNLHYSRTSSLNKPFIVSVYVILFILINLVLKYYNQSVYIPNYKISNGSVLAAQATLISIGLAVIIGTGFIDNYGDNHQKTWRPVYFAITIFICLYYLAIYHAPTIYRSLNSASYAFKNADIQPGSMTETIDENPEDIDFYNRSFRAIYNFVNSKEGELQTLISGFDESEQMNVRNRLIELAYMLVRPVEDSPNQSATFSYSTFMTNFNTTNQGISYIFSLIVIGISIFMMWPSNNDYWSFKTPEIKKMILPFGFMVIFYFILIFVSFFYKDTAELKLFDELLFGVGSGSYRLGGAILGVAIGMSLLLAALNVVASFVGPIGPMVLQFIILWVLFTRSQTIQAFFHDYYVSLTSNETVQKPTHYDPYAPSGKMTMYYVLMIVFFTVVSGVVSRKVDAIEGIFSMMKGLFGGCCLFMIVAFPYIVILLNLLSGLFDIMMEPSKTLLVVDPFRVLSGQLVLEWAGIG